jgi:hypothetical protein
VKAIPGVPEITGLEYVPGLRKVYTSDRGETKVGVVALDRMQVIKRIRIGQKPNGSAYAEPFAKMPVTRDDPDFTQSLATWCSGSSIIPETHRALKGVLNPTRP